MYRTTGASELEFIAESAPASAPRDTELLLWVSVHLPSFKPCRSLTLSTFGLGPTVSGWPIYRATGVWSQVDTISEILDALLGKVLVEMSPGKLSLRKHDM